MSSREEFPLYGEVSISLQVLYFFQIDIGSFNELYHFIFVSYLLDKHTYMLTNFSAFI